MKYFVWREINPECLSRQIPGSLRQFDGSRRIGLWPKDLVWLYSLVKRHWLFATNQFLSIASVSWFNEGNLFLQPYKNLQCPQDFPHSLHIHIPCSPIFHFCLILTVESQAHSVGTIAKNYSQFKKATCLSGLPVTCFLRSKVFTYIIFFHKYMTESPGVVSSLITTRLLHKAMALTKSTRKRNKNNFHNARRKQN